MRTDIPIYYASRNPSVAFAVVFIHFNKMKVVDQVVFILEKVHIIWEPLLLPSRYKRCMSAILELVLSRITKDILLLDDIAVEETLEVQICITTFSFYLLYFNEAEDNLPNG